ncbi:MAG TPA: DUF3109 family protein [Leptolinea sp.]
MKVYEINPRMQQSEPMTRCKLHECQAACCIYGVWIDQLEAEKIIQFAEIIRPEMPESWQNPKYWFDEREEADERAVSGIVVHSRVIESARHYGASACIFLKADNKCALQTAARKAGMHPWSLKPFYCILHPLDLDEKGRITLDDTGLLLDEPGSCVRPSKRLIPLVDTFEPELRFFLGDQEFENLHLFVT